MGEPGIRRVCAHERGAALAELVIVVPIMLMLLLVTFDFGRGFLEYVSVVNGARDGARVGATLDESSGKPICEVDQSAVVNAARSGAEPLAIAGSDVIVGWDAGTGQCSVTVRHTYGMVLPFVDSQFQLPIIGTIGPLWNGKMAETMVSA